MGFKNHWKAESNLRAVVMRAAMAMGGGPFTVSALAAQAGIERASVRYAVTGMVERGLMTRTASAHRHRGGLEGLYCVVQVSPWDE